VVRRAWEPGPDRCAVPGRGRGHSREVNVRPRVASGLAFVAIASLSAGVVLGMYLPAPAGRVGAGSVVSATPGETAAANAARPTPPPSVPGAASPSPTGTTPPSPSPTASAGATTRPTASSAVPASVSVPILYYHRVQALPAAFAAWTPTEQRTFLQNDVLPAAFTAQLDWLQENGYTTILPRDLAAHWDSGSPLPPKPVILTFDDGTADWADTVGPLLREHGMVAEFYVVVENVARALTWDEVRALAAAGNGIGAHGLHHVQLTALGNGSAPASAAVMRAEVEGAMSRIAAQIGQEPDSFSYVGGGYDTTLSGIVRTAGFTTARSIKPGLSADPDLRYALRVVRIGAYDDVRDVFAGTLVPGLPTFERRVTGKNPG
jgi:peptidoglycan/xylan/chitin deacetylase (PgdA/CDA1 family)